MLNTLEELTPVEKIGNLYVKRDDKFVFAGMRGGKVRTCHYIISNSKSEGVITAGAKDSPQVNIVANVAKALGKKCRVHVPANKTESIQITKAREAGAEIVFERPGYNSVIVSRAEKDAKESGWTYVPFGMECQEAVQMTRREVRNLPFGEFKRIVVPVGSGMSLCGILYGLRDMKQERNVEVLGVQVGADPTKRLMEYGRVILDLPKSVKIIKAEEPYDQKVFHQIRGNDETFISLDPIYEAKCFKYLQDGDLFWIVGRREE